MTERYRSEVFSGEVVIVDYDNIRGSGASTTIARPDQYTASLLHQHYAESSEASMRAYERLLYDEDCAIADKYQGKVLKG